MQKNFYKNKKSLLNLLLILTIISHTLFYSPQKNIISGDTSYNNDELSNVYFPNTSDGEITIITPKNKTYTEPMGGYYPATYGFENDLDGTIPQDWFLGIATGGTAQVVSERGGRKKVVQMVDTVTDGYPYLLQIFTLQTTGIVEFYIRKESGSTQAGFELRSAGVIATGIRIDYNNNGKFEAYQGAGYLEIAAGDYSDQTWFHIKIAFDTSTDTADFYVNGTLEASNIAFKQDVVSIDRIYFGPNYLFTGSFYFDAVGYSWDSDYNTGDNLNEGLLLSYDNTTTLDWKGFSLDGVANNTILGNTTIPLPEDGNHNIQIFGNDSLGTVYESDIRHFAVDQTHYIEIITPENRMYTGPMSGYYPGSFGFEDNLPGTIPDGWYTRSSGDGYYEIDHLLDDHYNVYEIRKSGGTSKVETYKILPQSTTIGTIEFWLYKDTDSSTDPTRITLRDEPTGGYIPFGIENEDLFIGKWSEKIYTFDNVFSKNEWHHIRVDFDLSVGWQLKLDDTWYGAGYAFTVYASDHPPPSKINTFHVESIYSGDNPSYGAWFDAISYSWDSNYNSGDNLNEGLLLSYTNATNLDWIGYSLDGSPNITITGNKVIPFPENGMHSIILSGNTSYGVLIKSESRDFAIIFQDPYIPPENPYIILIVFGSIGTGIFALLSIAIFLFRRRIPSRASSTIIFHKKPQLDEHVDSGSDRFKACPLCHTQIKATDQFCEYCGTSLKSD